MNVDGDVSHPAVKGQLPYAAWATAALLLTTLVAVYFMLGTLMSTPACGSGCDFDLLAKSTTAFYILALLPALLSAVGSYLLRTRGWWVMIAPAAGFLLLGIVYFIATYFADVALRL